MITQLKDIIKTANPAYKVEFEESAMMNIRVDDFKREDKFAYIEEYRQGKYFKEGFVNKKSTIVQIYFCQFTELHDRADVRERIRMQIESEIVLPFMNAFNNSGKFEKVDSWPFFTPLPRFNANEVSIMLQFDLKQAIC